jgi:hypothetical protein
MALGRVDSETRITNKGGRAVVSEEALVRGLQVLTEGQHAGTADRPEGRARAAEPFQAESEMVRERAREWTHGPGIEGLGVGEKISAGNPAGELALRVYVERKLAKRSVEHPVPSTVEVPQVGELVTDVVELGHVEPESFRERARPAMPGCGVGHVAATVGTFGCLVRRTDDEALYILSNAHVLADVGFGQPGDVVVQPGVADGGDEGSDALAMLADFVPFAFDDVGFDNQVDAAIARVRRSDWVVTQIRELGVAPAGVGRVIRRGMHVKKVGRTTGYTTGVVQDIHFRTALTYPRANGARTRRVGFRDQVLCTRYSDGGDSGAVVLNSTNRAIGLHFAGAPAGSAFNRIGHVLRLLRLELA